jgi:RNA polymerase sigma-70 factor (ECF subfamily)
MTSGRFPANYHIDGVPLISNLMSKSIWPSDEKTETLLSAARLGDANAVDKLLERHRGPIRRLVELRLDRKVQRRVDVSDVVQDVLIEANGRLGKYLDDPAMAFHLWLRQIAWDRIIDTYRRHRVSAKRNMDREQPMIAAGSADQSTMDLAAQLCDPAMTPAAAATQREIAAKVESVIEQLGDQDREMILMRHFEHLTNLEIAEVLGLNPPAASMRYLRAIRRLRELLEDQQVEAPDD